MESAILTVIALLSFVMWRLVFTALPRTSAGAIAGPRRENDNLARRRLRLWGLPGVEVIIESGWEPGFYRIGIAQAESRADMYLHRVIALTGATQKGNSYFLDVGTTRFQVWDKFIRRIEEASDPKGRYEEMCFYSTSPGIPRAEQIAAALLQLRNNPGLFEKWAEKDRAFKADGQPFRRVRHKIKMRVRTKNSPANRAAEYLRRIARLTGAKQIAGGSYRLRAGRRDFLVDCKFVRVISHHGKSTCFSLGTDPDMPSAEIVASVLLQLKNNPRLFKKWRKQPGYMFKANGKKFGEMGPIIWPEAFQ